METLTEARDLVEHPRFRLDRQDALSALDPESIDEPIVDIFAGFASLPHCFTLQSCYGHFVCGDAHDPRSLEPVPCGCGDGVRYRIAYLAICVENSGRGQRLRESLARLADIDRAYIQFGSADWFWERCVNSYVVQVDPVAHELEDEAVLEPAEALETQRARADFFTGLRALLAREIGEHAVP